MTDMKELSVFVLLMLACLSEGKPLQRVRRTIVKDYFNPLTYPTVKLQFEKGEDGKYHEQKHADPLISKVEYVVAHGIDASNEIFGEASNSFDKNLQDEDAVIANTENAGLSPVSSTVEFQKESIDHSAKIVTTDKDKLEVKDASRGEAIVPETTAKLNSETKPEDSTSKYGYSAKLDIPVDSKWSLVPKPDGKDDKSYEGGEDYVPEPPIAPEEKNDEGKVEIDQIPKHHPVFVPPNIPLLIPKTVSFRVLSLFPKLPAIDISDRLPLPEPEVIEESAETAVVENISPRGSTVIKEGRRYLANHFINPLRFGLQLPFFPTEKGLKDGVDEEKFKGLVKSKVVEIGGRKMLLQRKVLIAPDNDPSKLHISVMSIQPLEEVDPEILKELDIEKKELESEETSLEKELNLDEKKEAEKRSLKDDAVETVVKKEGEKGAEIFPKLIPEPEILDVKKTEVIEGKAVDGKMSPSEVSAPTVPVVEMAKEDRKIEEKEGTTATEFELEAKINDKDAEESKESHAAKEFGLKTESKLDENVEKGKGMEILPIVSEEKKEEEKTTAVVKEDEDALIGMEDLLKFRGQVKSLNPTSVHPLITEVRVDVMKGEFGFERESQTKDEEAAQSKRVEVTLNPAEESKYNLDKVITEGKKGDEAFLNAEEVATSQSGAEFRASKGTKEQIEILKVESKDLVKGRKEEEEGINAKEAVFSHSSTEINTRKEAKEKTDIMKTEFKELDEEYKAEAKKGDDEILSAEDVLHGVMEIGASKQAKEKTDIMKTEFKELHEESKAEGKKGDDEILSAEDVLHGVMEIGASKEAEEKTDIMKIGSKELDEESKVGGKKADGEIFSAEDVSHSVMEITASKEAKEKIDIRNLQHSEESRPKIKDLGETKAEGAILEERKKKFEERKDKAHAKKKKCKCEDSEESDSDDEDDLE